MAAPTFPAHLGPAPWRDVEAVAQLVVHYRRDGSADYVSLLLDNVADRDAVLERATEIEGPALRLGAPPADDVQGAAELYVRYQGEGGLTPEGCHMFFRMVSDPDAVQARIAELSRTG